MADDTTPPEPPNDAQPDMSQGGALGLDVQPIEIQEEMEQSFLDYAMSVIVARALPDARDGLKPVHRRILWAMYDSGIRPERPHRKCATVVGDVIGNYHPHGDTAIYDALVRMGQSFSLRHILIDPQGNFGSPSDPPAAYRYTECRLTPLAMRLVDGIDEDTVDFVPNFDGSKDEPEVLPARFPNLLVNGSQGIAVGMATSIPTHNLGEVVAAAIHLLDHPDATVEDLMGIVAAPDFPTGCLIMGRQGSMDAYRTGRGSVRMRAVAEITEGPRGAQIVVSAIPYQTSVEAIEEKIAAAVDRKDIEGIRELRNESAKGVTRFVIELRKDASAHVVLNNLYRYTPLQSTFPVNMVALVDGVPRTLDLLQLLQAYIAHQVEVITRRSQFRLQKARDRAHIVEGLLKAIDLIDDIIALIRRSEDRAAARAGLMSDPLTFSEVQANHILDMPLGRLTRLGRSELTRELEELQSTIAELEAVLADEDRMRGVIRAELEAVANEFATPRRSEITFDPGDMDIEDLIDDEDLVVSLSARGYVKAVSADAFRTQGRGGRGVQGTKVRDEDVVMSVVTTSAHAELLFFTNRGKVYRIRAHQIPMMDRTARGTAVVNLLQLEPGETVQAVIDTRDYETARYLFFATRMGKVKKTRFTDYGNIRQNGLIAVNLGQGDELVCVRATTGDDELLMVSRAGQAIRFSEAEVRPMGRSAAGVRGMGLRQGDVVVSCDVIRPGTELLVVSDQGFGKRTPVAEFPRKGRGTLGVKAVKLMDGRGGGLVAAMVVETSDELILMSQGGVLIRVPVEEIAVQGRTASGVRIMNVPAEDHVAAVTVALSTNGDPASDATPDASSDATAEVVTGPSEDLPD